MLLRPYTRTSRVGAKGDPTPGRLFLVGVKLCNFSRFLFKLTFGDMSRTAEFDQYAQGDFSAARGVAISEEDE
jgi:hypothetical protein